MYRRTIREFLTHVSILESSFKKWNNNKDLNSITESKEQLSSTDTYLEKLKADNDRNNNLIWMLIKDTYYSEDTPDSDIANEIDDIIKKKRSEIASWIFSLPALAQILSGDGKPNDKHEKFLDAQIVLEARFYYGERVDVAIIGNNENGEHAMVLIENKRWADLEKRNAKTKDPKEDEIYEITNPLYEKDPKNNSEFLVHPCKQVEQYRIRLKNVNGFIQNSSVIVDTAVYLLNPTIKEEKINKVKKDNCFLGSCFDKLIAKNPVFYGRDGINISNNNDKEGNLLKYLENRITGYGQINGNGLAEEIYGSKVKFSKNISKVIYKLSDDEHIGEQKKLFDILLGEKQKSIINDILEHINANKKRELEGKEKESKVFIIKGSAGTGKSFMGLALLSHLAGEIKNNNKGNNEELEDLIYLVKCHEPRIILAKIYNLEVIYSIAKRANNKYDCIICDDAQRYQEIFSNTERINPLSTIIDNSYASVFFIDEDQIVHGKDYITVDKITQYCKNYSIDTLKEQYRMKHSGLNELNFLDIVNNILGKSPKTTTNKNKTYSGYEFALADSSEVLFSRIRCKNKQKHENCYTSRVVAGKGKSDNNDWKWSTEFETIGPLRDDKKYKAWKHGDKKWKYENKVSFITGLDKDGNFPVDYNGKEINAVDYVGCIDFCQGVNLEYVGVIIASDLVYKNNTVEVKLDKHAVKDSYISCISDNSKKEEGIRNAYRVLLTRGEKGCYIYCCEESLNNYLHESLGFPQMNIGKVKKNENGYYISCENSEEYWISNQTVKDTEENHDLKIAEENLKKDVTFIVKISETDNKKYAISLEPHDPLPNTMKKSL